MLTSPAPDQPAEVPGADQPLRIWRDRRGRRHQEQRASPRHDEPPLPRVTGPLESAWEHGDRQELRRQALGRPNPHIEPDPEDPSSTLWTWVVTDTRAHAVVLWTNPVFDHRDARRSELVRLPDSDLWTICLKLPAALRASYRIGFWHAEEPPPWRLATGRRAVILAASRASRPDARGTDTVRGSWGERSSVGAGPLAPAEWWREGPTAEPSSRVDRLTLPGGRQAWIYSPGATAAPTPLLVLFDGQVWNGMGLAALMSAAIRSEAIPPMHVAMLDSGDVDHRWSSLGVPAGQVDTVIDQLLPRVRAGWPVDPAGASTWISGQSLGGLASLWTLALSEGQIQHAIAQSPSLWRFRLAEALLTEPGWRSLELQAGTFEGDLLGQARALAADLQADTRIGQRTVRRFTAIGGHDWAVWRAGLIGALSRALPAPQ